MDVERAIEHQLELHARAEARMDRMDRQIVAIQKIVKTGMKLIVRIETTQADRQKAQARTTRRSTAWPICG